MYAKILAKTLTAVITASLITVSMWGTKVYANIAPPPRIYCVVQERPVQVAEEGWLIDEVSGLPLFDAVTGLMLMA